MTGQRFLKLTLIHDEPIVVNPDTIMYITRVDNSTDGSRACLALTVGSTRVYVKETPDDVLNQLRA